MYDDDGTPAQPAGDSAVPPPSQRQAPPRSGRASPLAKIELPANWPTECDPDRPDEPWCGPLLWLMHASPKGHPWVVGASARKKPLAPVVRIFTPKKHKLGSRRPILLRFCPFCGHSLVPSDLVG